jgi:hypothetical protein
MLFNTLLTIRKSNEKSVLIFGLLKNYGSFVEKGAGGR